MKNKVIFVLISFVFVLLCICIVLGSLLNRSMSSEYINPKGSTVGFTNADNLTASNQREPIFDKININTASKEDLIRLKGIGEVLAQNIINYRDEYGHFDSIEEIMYVKGIGKAKFNDIKDFITVSE